MTRDEFLNSLAVPVHDYAALRQYESEQKKPKSAPSVFDKEGQLSVDVYETPTHAVITAPVAGVPPEQLDITVSGDMVTIRGTREDSVSEQSDDRTYYYRECYFGTFSRTVILPMHIAGDRAEATIRNGLLVVRIPKTSDDCKVPIQDLS